MPEKSGLIPAPGVVVIISAMPAALSVHKRQQLQQRLKTRNRKREKPKNRRFAVGEILKRVATGFIEDEYLPLYGPSGRTEKSIEKT